MSDYQSIRNIRYSNLSHLDHKDLEAGKLPGGSESLCWEIFNGYPNAQGVVVNGPDDIVLVTVHKLWRQMHFFGKSPREWARIRVKPGEWAFIPHGMYIVSYASKPGQPVTAVCNFGDMMFKGNKLPSRPEVSKMRVFKAKRK